MKGLTTAPVLANPYVGPSPFGLREPMYGRERESRELVDLLLAERIVLLHAPSGAGKTSLLQAKVIPALEDEGFEVSGPLRVSALPPDTTGSPNRYLWSVLDGLWSGGDWESDIGPQATLAQALDVLDTRAPRPGAAGDADRVRDHVLVIDQFEEVLTLDPTDWKGQDEFFRQIGQALEPAHRWALFSMREDYLGGLDRFRRRIPTHLRTTYRLDFLSHDAAVRAARGPAEAAGVRFPVKAAELLVEEVSKVRVQRPCREVGTRPGPYAEPVQLQVHCHRLWRALEPKLWRKAEIREDDVRRVLEEGDALAEYYAEAVREVAEKTGTSERAIRDWFENELISRSTGFRTQTMTGPEVDDKSPTEVLKELADRYLIRSEERGAARWYELAHDGLLDPVRADNAAWRRAKLTSWEAAAEEWARNGKHPSLLLRGEEIRRAEAWVKARGDGATLIEREFLVRSREEWAKKTWRETATRTVVRLALISVVELVALIGCVIWIVVLLTR